MSTPARLLVLAAGAVAAVVLFFVFRGDDDSGKQAQATTETTTGTTETAPEPSSAILRLDARTPGIKRISVRRDERVVIIVATDGNEEIHLHGYDLKAKATAAQPGRITFRADQPGRFEIELEDSGEQIAELTVNP